MVLKKYFCDCGHAPETHQHWRSGTACATCSCRYLCQPWVNPLALLVGRWQVRRLTRISSVEKRRIPHGG